MNMVYTMRAYMCTLGNQPEKYSKINNAQTTQNIRLNFGIYNNQVLGQIYAKGEHFSVISGEAIVISGHVVTMNFVVR